MLWNDTTEKRTLAEEWGLLWRGVKLLNKMMPHFWLYQTLCTIAETFFPYFGLYMSAQMVNELAGDCDQRKLLQLAGITVLGGLLVSIAIKLLQSRWSLCDTFLHINHGAYLADVQNGFQYGHIEDPDIRLRRAEIQARINANGAGLINVKREVSSLLGNILGVVFSVSLTVSMFTMTAQGSYTGVLGFINSPVSAVVVVALILFNVVCSVKIAAARSIGQQRAVSKLAKENVSYFKFYRLWGADMIVFDLNPFVLEMLRNRLHREWVAELEKVTIRYNFLSIMLNAVLNLCIFLFTAARAFIGVFGIGSFILYQGTTKRFIEAVSAVAAGIGRLRHNNQYLVSLYEYLDLPNDMYKGTLAVEKRDDIDYEIEFRDVSFRYPRSDSWALRHVSIRFRIGNKMAIVGENGSGKTTFIKLLCRLYDPTEGEILLNGIDIRKYDYKEYMEVFSVVFQDFELLAYSVGQNIAASETYDRDRAESCCRKAGFWERVETMRQGLDTILYKNLSEDGVEISGGEEQKLAIARAMYRDAAFLILDEPTAALDPMAEYELYTRLNEIVEDRTAIYISHRLSSCRFCDEIIVFHEGSMVQQGDHGTLLAQAGGKYSELWNAQAQYYVADAQ